MKRLNGMDAMLLYNETPNLHTHTLNSDGDSTPDGHDRAAGDRHSDVARNRCLVPVAAHLGRGSGTDLRLRDALIA